jgi:hypothetical protein
MWIHAPSRAQNLNSRTTLFARLSPAHKQRIVHVLRGKGHVVGFLEDGINDAPALAILSDHIVSADLRVEMLSLKQIQCSHLTIIPLNSYRFESLHQNQSDCSVV